VKKYVISHLIVKACSKGILRGSKRKDFMHYMKYPLIKTKSKLSFKVNQLYQLSLNFNNTLTNR